jgi:hypothetical protein
MKTLFQKWASKVPRYSARHADLFEQFAQKGNVSEHARSSRGKVFSSLYELYIYAFFLGLYHGPNEEREGDDNMTDFGHPIEHWGKKGGKLLRTDYSEIQHYIFAASVIHSEVDFIELDKDLITIDEAATSILRVTEKIANRGLNILRDQLLDKEAFGAKPVDFASLIMNAPKS